LIVAGLARYGYREEANRISTAMIDAASYTGHRLPEAFSGFPRTVSRFPVPYPTACSPQAWAAGAPLLFLRAMLGLEAIDGTLTIDPLVPHQIGRVAVKGIPAFGTHWDVEAEGTEGEVTRSAR
jgi:glycogen debranching enzyme